MSRSALSGLVTEAWLSGLFLIDQTAKPIAKFATGTVQTAANRAHGHVEDGTDLLVTMAVKIFQDDDGTVFGTQLVEGRLDDLLALGPLQREGRDRLRAIRRRGSSRGSARAFTMAEAGTGLAAADGRSRPD